MNGHIFAMIPHYENKGWTAEQAKEALVEWTSTLMEDTVCGLLQEWDGGKTKEEILLEKEDDENELEFLHTALQARLLRAFEEVFGKGSTVDRVYLFGDGGPSWMIAGGTDNFLPDEYDSLCLLSETELFWVTLSELARNDGIRRARQLRKEALASMGAKDSDAADELLRLLFWLSDDLFSATWYTSVGFYLWSVVTKGKWPFATTRPLPLQEDIAKMQDLADKAGGWFEYLPNDIEPSFIPMKKWRSLYKAWDAKMNSPLREKS